MHPSGVFPERLGSAISAADVASAVFGPGPPLPDGIGVNCTGATHLEKVIAKMAARVERVELRRRPWLVIYPNGRDWDTETHTWASLGSSDEDAAEKWADAVVRTVAPHVRGDIWAGVIVGGCCKSGPREIAALSAAVTNLE